MSTRPSAQRSRSEPLSALIVGAGPTELTLACELTRDGIPFHLIESARRSRVTSRFDATMRDRLSENSLAAARAGDATATNTSLSMEAAEHTARITFRDDRSIAGPVVLPGETS